MREPEDREGWIAPDAVTSTLDADRFDGRVITSIRYKRDGVLTLRPHYSVVGEEPALCGSGRRRGGQTPHRTPSPFQCRDRGLVSGWSAALLFRRRVRGRRTERGEHGRPLDGAGHRRSSSPPDHQPGDRIQPSVSPDGRRMAFLSTPARGAETDLMVVEIGSDGSFRGSP